MQRTINIVELNGGIPNSASAKRERGVALYCAGKLDEARAVTLEALNETEDNDLRLILAFNWAMIERGAGNYLTALSIHTLSQSLFEQTSSNTLKGKYANGLATTYLRLGLHHKALIEYKNASRFHELAGDFVARMETENNIAYLLISIGQASEAVQRLERLKRQFKALNLQSQFAEVEDTLNLARQKVNERL
jgi:tetratricopeptide (TPR) repeat protein